MQNFRKCDQLPKINTSIYPDSRMILENFSLHSYNKRNPSIFMLLQADLNTSHLGSNPCPASMTSTFSPNSLIFHSSSRADGPTSTATPTTYVIFSSSRQPNHVSLSSTLFLTLFFQALFDKFCSQLISYAFFPSLANFFPRWSVDGGLLWVPFP